jgi:hypothetical protein
MKGNDTAGTITAVLPAGYEAEFADLRWAGTRMKLVSAHHCSNQVVGTGLRLIADPTQISC